MSIFEQVVLDSLALNDRTNFIMQDFDPGIAPKRWQWISGTDSDGAVLPEEAHYDNAEMTLRIRIAPQATMDAALAKIGQIVDKLQECEQQPDGLAAVWTPANSTKSLTAYVLGGEVTGVPIAMSGDDAGWFLRNPAPVVTIKLYRRPFLYGTEVTSAATVTNSNPYQLLTVANVTGDVPAEARLVVTDAASQSRRFVRWGRRWRYYDAAASLYIDSDSMVTTGFTGTATTRAGAHDPNASGNSVIRGTLTPVDLPQAICGLGNLGHVGNYRAILRCYPNSSGLTEAAGFKVRLAWKEGDGPLRANAWVSPAARNTFSEVDLGIVSIPPKTLGTQRWTGQIEAYTMTTAGDTLDVDYVLLYPVDGYGAAMISPYYSTPTAYTGRDEFDQTAGALSGKTAPVGGVWAGVGTVGDADLTVNAATHKVDRTTTNADASESGRGANVPQTMTNTLVQVDFTSAVSAVHLVKPQVMARYVDENNYARFMVVYFGATLLSMYLQVVVGGTVTSLINQTPGTPITSTSPHTLRLQVDDAGGMFGWFGDTGSLAGRPPTIASSHPALAAGGVLASGKPGFRDAMSTGGAGSILRSYDNFVAASSSVDAVVFSGRSAEINSQKAERADSTGTYYGPIQSVRGAHFFLDPSGDESRTNEILVAAKRNNVEVAADDQIADSTTVTVHYTPRWSTVPR